MTATSSDVNKRRCCIYPNEKTILVLHIIWTHRTWFIDAHCAENFWETDLITISKAFDFAEPGTRNLGIKIAAPLAAHIPRNNCAVNHAAVQRNTVVVCTKLKIMTALLPDLVVIGCVRKLWI